MAQSYRPRGFTLCSAPTLRHSCSATAVPASGIEGGTLHIRLSSSGKDGNYQLPCCTSGRLAALPEEHPYGTGWICTVAMGQARTPLTAEGERSGRSRMLLTSSWSAGPPHPGLIPNALRSDCWTSSAPRSRCSLWRIKDVEENVLTSQGADGTVDEDLPVTLIGVKPTCRSPRCTSSQQFSSGS